MTQNSWNAEYNSAKGALLVGNGTRPIVRSVGADGQVLTANSVQADGVEWVTPGSGALVNLSPYIVGPTQSDFATISAAIAQAVIDGVSSSNQINIYVKPQSGGYTENITLPGWINIIGFPENGGSIQQSATNSPMAVVLNGTITFSGSNVGTRIENIQLTPTGSSPFNVGSTGSIFLSNVLFSDIANAVSIFNCSGISNIQLNECYLTSINAGAALISGSSCPGNFTVESSTLQSGALSVLSGTAINFRASNCQLLVFSFDVTGVSIPSSCFVDLFDCRASSISANGFLISSTVNSALVARYCVLSTPSLVTTVASCTLLHCQTPGIFVTDSTISVLRNCDALANSEISGSDTGCETFRNFSSGGYSDSIYVRSQKFLTTGGAVATAIASVVLNEEEAITLKGQIIGSNVAHTDITGGTFMICARRTTAGNVTQVGTTTVDIKADSTATFTCDVDIGTQTVRVMVTGIAATSYNWTTTFEYQKMLTSS